MKPTEVERAAERMRNAIAAAISNKLQARSQESEEAIVAEMIEISLDLLTGLFVNIAAIREKLEQEVVVVPQTSA